MKILVYIRPGRFDTDELIRRHPGHDFAVVHDATAAARELPDAEMMVTWTSAYDRDFVTTVKETARKLKWIQLTTSGIDNILKVGGFPTGVIVTNSAGLSAPMVAEHAFALMLAIGHRLCDAEAERARRSHTWLPDMRPTMSALFRKTICIIGLGAIGQEAAKRARAFDMDVIGVSRGYRPDDLVSEVFPRERLNDALARADVVLLSTTVTAETVNIIGREALAAMKPDAILVNIARGDLVDEDALAAALRDGKLLGAGLDVTRVEPLPEDSPLWDPPNVIITPHAAGGGADTSDILLEMVDDNIRRYTAGEPLARVCDWENVKLPT